MKKKLLLIVSMLAVTFMFAGCSLSDGTKKVEFDYDEQEIAQVATDLCTTYQNYASHDETYNYVVEAGDDDGVDESVKEAVQSFRDISDQCGDFKEFTGEYEISETEGKVIVTLYADCTEKEALVKVSFEDNSATYNLQKYQLINQYGYSEDEVASTLASSQVYPYKMSDVEIAANMSSKDKMEAAGTHTLIGMGTVFIVLIFISFIIYLLRFVPKLFNKTEASEKSVDETQQNGSGWPEAQAVSAAELIATPAGQIVDIVNAQTGASVMNDTELVAVIAAAVAASGTSQGAAAYVTYPSKDKLIARKIRRIKR